MVELPLSVQGRWELPLRDRYTFRSSVLSFHYLLVLVFAVSIDSIFPELSGWVSRREQGAGAAVHRDIKACLGWFLSPTTTLGALASNQLLGWAVTSMKELQSQVWQMVSPGCTP